MATQIGLDDFHSDWIRLVDKSILEYEMLTPDERIWFNVQVLLQHVSNGGLLGYYADYSGDHLTDTITDLEALGAFEIVEMLQKVNELFPGGTPPADIEERNNIISDWEDDAIANLLDDLDETFLEHEANLERLLLAHILSKGLNITS